MDLHSTKRNPPATETLGGEVAEGWDDTGRLTKRLESFGELKHRTREFVDWARDGGIPLFDLATTKIFQKLDNCGLYLIFRNYLVSHRSRLIGSCTCKKHLLCAFCASRRGVKNARAYREKTDFLINENPNLRLVFFTITVKNGDDLMERFEHLRSAMQKFLSRRNHELRGTARSVHHTEFSKMEGGVFAYEFKRGAAGQWHPHVHGLALVPRDFPLDAQLLKDELLDITGDSHVINLQFVKDETAFLEVFAYALKFSEMAHEDRWFAFQKLTASRLISSFGSLRGLEISDDADDDILVTDEPYVDFLFKWYFGRGYIGANISQSVSSLPSVLISDVDCPY